MLDTRGICFMPKSQSSSKSRTTSAAKRREQQKQRQRESNQKNQPSARNRRRGRQQASRRPWILVGGVLLVIAIVVVIFIFIASQPSSGGTGNGSGNGAGRTVATTSVVNAVTQVDPTLLSQIGTGGVSNPFKAASSSSPLLTGPTGKPEVFFYGAEWCPICAAERWSIAAALSRFGTFHNLGETTSSSTDSYPNTATLTFYQSSYTSSYIDFVPIENADRQQNILQTPTANEQQLLTKYNVSGYPFMDIGDRYLIAGASYDPAVLRSNPQDPNSQPLTQQEIASQLSTQNTLSKNVLGVANYLTAAICSITKNQPSQVCSDASIQSIEASLPKISQSGTPSGSSPLLALSEPAALDIRQRYA